MYDAMIANLREIGISEDEIRGMVDFERAGEARAHLVRNDWCRCDPRPDQDECAYYRRADGSHGWFHAGCCGITQTG